MVLILMILTLQFKQILLISNKCNKLQMRNLQMIMLGVKFTNSIVMSTNHKVLILNETDITTYVGIGYFYWLHINYPFTLNLR